MLAMTNTIAVFHNSGCTNRVLAMAKSWAYRTCLRGNLTGSPGLVSAARAHSTKVMLLGSYESRPVVGGGPADLLRVVIRGDLY